MRLKEDSSNWKASNIERKINELPEEPRLARSKKNTRKWCKGKVGTKHNYILISEDHFMKWIYKKSVCTNCGKEKYS